MTDRQLLSKNSQADGFSVKRQKKAYSGVPNKRTGTLINRAGTLIRYSRVSANEGNIRLENH